MERVPARVAAARRQLAVLADEAVADGALAAPAQRADDVAAPREQAVDDAVVAEGDDPLRRPQPGLPPALLEGGAGGAGAHLGLAEGEGGRQLDEHGQRVLVVVAGDGVAGGDLAGGDVDFDGERAAFVGGDALLLLGPFLHGLQGRGDDEGGHVLRGPGLDDLNGAAGFAFHPPGLHERGCVSQREVVDADEQVLEISAGSVSIVEVGRCWVDVVGGNGLPRRVAQVTKDEVKQGVDITALFDTIGVLIPQQIRLRTSVIKGVACLGCLPHLQSGRIPESS